MSEDLVHLIVASAKASEQKDGPEPTPLCTPWPKCCNSGPGCYLD